MGTIAYMSDYRPKMIPVVACCDVCFSTWKVMIGLTQFREHLEGSIGKCPKCQSNDVHFCKKEDE